MFTLAHNKGQEARIVDALAPLGITDRVILHIEQESDQTADKHRKEQAVGNKGTLSSNVFQIGKCQSDGHQITLVQEEEFWNQQSLIYKLHVSFLEINRVHRPSAKGVKESLLHD